MIADEPFPHWVGGFFGEPLLGEVLAEIEAFPKNDPRWKRFKGEHERKLEGSDPSMWGPATKEYFTALEGMLPLISGIFGVPDLTLDTLGGGWHAIEPGGFLDVHYDFNTHPQKGHRRANVLTFLNHDWDDDGGHLLLGRDGEVSVAPEFGTTVIFLTSDHSWHGHPVPASRWRYSIAGYLYDQTDPGPAHSTVWA